VMPAGRGARGAAVALAVVVWAHAASGQTPAPTEAERPVEFLPRTAFHMTAEHLSSDDPRFVWDANFGGELDLVDYGVGRFAFEGNYQVIMGEEIRAFDPNQGNYILAGLASVRVGATEVAGVLYHQSRHLSDRPNLEPVNWNMIGGRVRHRIQHRVATVEARADLRGVFLTSFVDYSWELDAGVRSDFLVRPGVGILAAGRLRYLGVDGTRDRGGQTGYRAEGGVRFEGRAGAIELFVSAERRIDPSPLERGTADWVTAGFRLLSQ